MASLRLLRAFSAPGARAGGHPCAAHHAPRAAAARPQRYRRPSRSRAEFTSALCSETWFVADGGVAVSGGVAVPVANIAASVSSLSLVSSKAGSASVASLTSLDNLVRGFARAPGPRRCMPKCALEPACVGLGRAVAASPGRAGHPPARRELPAPVGWERCRLRRGEAQRRACDRECRARTALSNTRSAGRGRCMSLCAGPKGEGGSADRQDGPEDLDPETLEERVKEKARLKEEKAAIAAEKARLKAEKKKLRCAGPRPRAARAAVAHCLAVVGSSFAACGGERVLQLLMRTAHVEWGGGLVRWLPAEVAAVCARSRPEALSSAGSALPGRWWRIAACRSGAGQGVAMRRACAT
jgi:hypothetical protein